MRSRVSDHGESERQAKARVRGSSPVAHPYEDVLVLQRQIGNQAVAGILGPVVQRMDTGSPLTPLPDEMEDDFGQVISGHGRFNESQLATDRRKKLPTFALPDDMTVIMYAPSGAYLDNAVANRIELGNPPAADELELKQTDSQTTQPMPAGYPYTFTNNAAVIDYTVQPPDNLTIQGTPTTVEKPTPLRTLVEQAKQDGHTRVHYACCSSGYSDKADFKALFTHFGWYVRLKAAT